jgi:GT2 family glycosyltransferase
MRASVSVIIPTYLRPEVLPGCLDALEGQRERPAEVIVVDQSPDTRTRAVVSARSRTPYALRYVHSDAVGVSLARNLGLRLSTGELIAFTDDDAVPDAGWTEALLGAFETTPAEMVGGRVLPLWEGGKRPAWFPSSREYMLGIFDPGGPLAPFPEKSLPMTLNAAIRRATIERVGGFDTGAGPQPGRPVSGEDSLLAWRVRERGGAIFYQPDALVFHRVPRSRMQRRYYVRRAYLEGVSLIDIEARRGLLTPERLRTLRRHHRREWWRRMLSTPGQLSLAAWNDSRLLAHLGELALSAGIVESCTRVERSRTGA